MSGWRVAAGVLAVAAAGAAYSVGRRKLARGARRPHRIESGLGRLTPSTRAAVDAVIRRMRTLGYDAVVHETWRSPERARELAAKGAGIEDSMHRLGLAADIVSRSRGWAVAPAFWEALQDAAEAEGLVSGARWQGDEYDPAHVQSVAVASQRAAWSAKDPDELARVELAKRRLG